MDVFSFVGMGGGAFGVVSAVVAAAATRKTAAATREAAKVMAHGNVLSALGDLQRETRMSLEKCEEQRKIDREECRQDLESLRMSLEGQIAAVKRRR